jgi:hypothetical protein
MQRSGAAAETRLSATPPGSPQSSTAPQFKNDPSGYYTVWGFLHAAQENLAAGFSPETILAWAYDIAGRHGVRIRHDLNAEPVVAADEPADAVAEPAATEPAATEPVAAAAAAATEDVPEPADALGDAIAKLNPGGRARSVPVRVPVDFVRQIDGSHRLAIGDAVAAAGVPVAATAPPAAVSSVCRIVMSNAGRRAADAFALACNGLVIDTRTWRVLADPPPCLLPAGNSAQVNANLANWLYDIYPVDDGTVVTLYNWKNSAGESTWALASSNGYDVSSLLWSGPLTYAEVVHDLVTRLYPLSATEMGISIRRGPGKTTQLTFTHLDPNCCYTFGFRHHNFHPIVTDPERIWQIRCRELSGPEPKRVLCGLPRIPIQAPIMLPKEVRTMAQLQSFVCRDPSMPNYGYILRGIAGGLSDLLLETPLLTARRKVLYQRSSPADGDVAPQDRAEFTALRAFLAPPTCRGDFIAACPNWAPKYREYEEFVNNVVEAIVHTIRQRALAPAATAAPREPVGIVAAALYEHITACENLNIPLHKNIKSIVTDYVVNPRYAVLFLEALRKCRRGRACAPPTAAAPHDDTAAAAVPCAAAAPHDGARRRRGGRGRR